MPGCCCVHELRLKSLADGDECAATLLLSLSVPPLFLIVLPTLSLCSLVTQQCARQLAKGLVRVLATLRIFLSLALLFPITQKDICMSAAHQTFR